MTTYYFILGSQPALSVAEILAVLPAKAVATTCSREVLLVDIPGSFSAAEFMQDVGGTIKVGRILEDVTALNDNDLMMNLADRVEGAALTRPTFGVSVYRVAEGARLGAAGNRNLGMGVKKELKDRGVPSRWVKVQDGTALTSVAVEKNGLLKDGIEFVILADRSQIWLGQTEAVQPFEEFSHTDYGRPSRDTVQGMLPPKLARLMVNISAASRKAPILDPFCGSGTVVTEALHIGYTDALASDTNTLAISDTKKNFEWLLKEKYLPEDAKLNAFVCDARNAHAKVAADSIGGIVAETFLGKPKRGHEKRGELQKELGDLSRLYREALIDWKRILKGNATVVLAVPIYLMDRGREKHSVDLGGLDKIGYQIVPLLPPKQQQCFPGTLGKNNGLIYGRPGQLVWREIVKLKRTV